MKYLFLAFSGTLFYQSLFSQVVAVPVAEDDREPAGNYYYFYPVALYHKIGKYSDSTIQTNADSLKIFLFDSTRFHKEYGYLHRRKPHICCNRNGLYGVVNEEKNTIVPFEYFYIKPNYNPEAVVARKEGCWGVINSRQQQILDFAYYELDILGDKVLSAKQLKSDTAYKIFDLSANHKFSFASKPVTILENKYLKFFDRVEKKYCYFDLNGKKVTYEKIELEIKEKQILTVKDSITGDLGLQRGNGKVILKKQYKYLNYLKDYDVIIAGKATSSRNTKLQYGAFNYKGKLVFSFCDYFLSYTDRNKKILIAHDSLRKIGIASLSTGKITSAFEFDGFTIEYYLSGGYFSLKKGYFHALFSPEGKQLTEAKFTSFFMANEKMNTANEKPVICFGRIWDTLYGITKEGDIILVAPPSKNKN